MGMVPDRNNSCFTSTCPWYCEQRTAWLLPCECSGFQPSDGHYKKGLRNTLLGTTPHMSTDVTTCDQISQAFPVRTCILQAIIRLGGGEDLGTRLGSTEWEASPEAIELLDKIWQR